jgi:hypothetical protein
MSDTLLNQCYNFCDYSAASADNTLKTNREGAKDAREREHSKGKVNEGHQTYGERAVKTVNHTFFASFASLRFSSG